MPVRPMIGRPQCDDPLAGGVRRDHLAISAAGFFGEPFDEGRAVFHFAARFVEGLARFQRHQPGKILGLFDDQVVPGTQDVAAFLRGTRGPFAACRIRPLDDRRERRDIVQPHRSDMAAIRRMDHLQPGRIKMFGLDKPQGPIGHSAITPEDSADHSIRGSTSVSPPLSSRRCLIAPATCRTTSASKA
jgi:hypothetical protein